MVYRRLLIALLSAGAVFAAARPAAAQSFMTDAVEPRVNLPATLFTLPPGAVPVQLTMPVMTAEAPAPISDTHTSSALSKGIFTLCISTAVLQALDVRSTYAVIARGGAEGNPVLASVVPNKAAFIALKAGVATATILAVSKVAKHNKVAAVMALVAFNSVYATVVAHNFSLAHQMR